MGELDIGAPFFCSGDDFSDVYRKGVWNCPLHQTDRIEHAQGSLVKFLEQLRDIVLSLPWPPE